MRTRFDQFAKQLISGALSPAGSVQTDAEINHETQRADVLFEPNPERRDLLANVGLLGKLASGVSLFEPFHRTPDLRDVKGCLRKLLAFEHVADMRASRATPQSPEPTLWVLSAGRPIAVLRAFGFRRVRGFPRGVYRAPPGIRLGMVVTRELPTTRETLLLRLMSAGKVLKQAVAELLTLPDAAPERTLAFPLLVRLRFEIPEDPAQRTSEDVEFLMSTHDVVEAWKQKWIEEGMERGIAQGIAQGMERGIAQGMERGIAQGVERGIAQGMERGIAQGEERGIAQGEERGIVRTLVDVYEARFGAIPAELRAALERTHDEATLRGYSKLFGVGTASEIAEALRTTS
ncbi:MAG: hypothetical protein HUU21_17600 [Polyangiaceae bacterium]|nr:hypothetical protein [Polyangiaceae bacterium]